MNSMKNTRRKYRINKKWIIGNVFVATLGVAAISQIKSDTAMAASWNFDLINKTLSAENLAFIQAKRDTKTALLQQVTQAQTSLNRDTNLSIHQKQRYMTEIDNCSKEFTKIIDDKSTTSSLNELKDTLGDKFTKIIKRADQENKTINEMHRKEVLARFTDLEKEGQKIVTKLNSTDFNHQAVLSNYLTKMKDYKTIISVSLINSLIDSEYEKAKEEVESFKSQVTTINKQAQNPQLSKEKLLEIQKDDIKISISAQIEKLSAIANNEKVDISKLEKLSDKQKQDYKADIDTKLQAGLAQIKKAATKEKVAEEFNMAKALIEEVGGNAKHENLKLKDAARSKAENPEIDKKNEIKTDTPQKQSERKTKTLEEAKKELTEKLEDINTKTLAEIKQLSLSESDHKDFEAECATSKNQYEEIIKSMDEAINAAGIENSFTRDYNEMTERAKGKVIKSESNKDIQGDQPAPSVPTPQVTPEEGMKDQPKVETPKESAPKAEMPQAEDSTEGKQIASINLKDSTKSVDISKSEAQTIELEVKDAEGKDVADPGKLTFHVVGKFYDLGNSRLKIEQDKTKLSVTVLDNSIFPGEYTLKLYSEQAKKEFSVILGLKGTLPADGNYRRRGELSALATREKSDIDKLEKLAENKKKEFKDQIDQKLAEGVKALAVAQKDKVDEEFNKAKTAIEEVAGNAKKENLDLKNQVKPEAKKPETGKKEEPKADTPQKQPESGMKEEPKVDVPTETEKEKVPAPNMPAPSTPKVETPKENTPKAEMPKVEKPQVPSTPQTPTPSVPMPEAKPKVETPKNSLPSQNTTQNRNNVHSGETLWSGVVYVPVINGNRTWKVALLDQNGKYTGKYISTDSNWRVFAKKMINGKLYYRLGTQNQWIPAEYVGVKTMEAETPVNGEVYLPVINHNHNWKVALWTQDGKLAGKYLQTNSSWKVYAQKMINGKLHYRLGTQQQWVSAEHTMFYRK